MQNLAAKKGVALHLHTIIYKLMEQLREELSSKLPPCVSETVIGESRVQNQEVVKDPTRLRRNLRSKAGRRRHRKFSTMSGHLTSVDLHPGLQLLDSRTVISRISIRSRGSGSDAAVISRIRIRSCRSQDQDLML